MQLGVHLPHIGRKAGPENIRRVAVQAEQLGLDDVWVSEHIIVPRKIFPRVCRRRPGVALSGATCSTYRSRHKAST